jgi:hypothetical protein
MDDREFKSIIIFEHSNGGETAMIFPDAECV